MLQCVCHTHGSNVVKFQEIYIADSLVLQFLSMIEFKFELQRKTYLVTKSNKIGFIELISENLEI